MTSDVTTDAVDALFVRCIASADSLRAFRKAASRVKRLSETLDREHFAHLAAALDAQTVALETLRGNQRAQMSEHMQRRDRELDAFYAAHAEARSALLTY
jgi:hypothetical protein